MERQAEEGKGWRHEGGSLQCTWEESCGAKICGRQTQNDGEGMKS